MPTLRIQTLGPFQVWRRGQPISAQDWPTRKSQLLFKILLTERGHFVPADRLLDLLWPDLPPKRAQNNLWVAVSHARRVLQPDLPRRAAGDYILTRREGYTFGQDGDYWLDVEDLAAQLDLARWATQVTARTQALEAARRLYRGDYLEEDPYEEWALPTREHLRTSYLALLADLAEIYAQQGRYRRAISLCHESLATDNTGEAVYRQLMLYHYGAGDRSQALKTYDECCRVLRAEIDVEPLPETQDLKSQIRRRQVEGVDYDVGYPAPVEIAPRPFSPDRTPFVGREREYGQLARMAVEAAAGRGRVVLLDGEPGAGKSRLVQEMATFAAAQDMDTLAAHCYQVEQAVPYQPIVDLVRQAIQAWPPETLRQVPVIWLAEIAPIVPELTAIVPGLPATPADVGESRQGRFFQALVQLFATLAAGRPLLLVVDDAHWADLATMQFLHHLARHCSTTPILLLYTYRTGAIATDPNLASLVHAIGREPQTARVGLAPLSEKDVNTLLGSLVGSSPQALDLGAWLYHETGGNPFFLVSIVQSLSEQGLLEVQDREEWQLDLQALRTAGVELTLPEALRESVRDRLRRVPVNMRRILDLAAVLGRRFDFATLQTTCQQDQAVLLDAVEGLVARTLLHEGQEGNSFDFSHDKIREVVYHDLSGPRRTMLHLQVARALEAASGPRPGETASILAHHYERAGDNAEALAQWLRAGEHALATYAPQQALRHFERALALATEPQEKVAAYLGLGRAHFGQDDLPAAAADLKQGLRLAGKGDARRGQMFYLLADIDYARYDTEACESHAWAALAAADIAGDTETMSQSLSLLGQSYSSRGNLEAEFELIDQALTISRRARNHWREGRTLADLGWLQAQTADFAQAARSAEQALEILETTDDRAGVAFAWNVLGRARGGQGQYAAAFDAFQNSREIAESIGHKFLTAQVPNMLGWLYQQLYDFERALVNDRQGVELARQWGKMPAEISACINVAQCTLHLGDPKGALAELAAARQQIEREASGFHAWRWRLRLLHAQGQCTLALGESASALDLAREGMALATATSSLKYVALNHELGGAALARLDRQREAEAEPQSARAEPQSARAKPQSARAELQSAVALADAIQYQPLRWQARRRLAALYRQTGQDLEADQTLGQAARIVRDIAGSLPDELRASFLAVKPVRAILDA